MADFGESKIIKAKNTVLQSLTAIRGTPLYFPPELLLSIDEDFDKELPASPTQDIWSLGIITHQLYSNGENPFMPEKNSNWRKNVLDGNIFINSMIEYPFNEIIKGSLFFSISCYKN